MVKFFSSEKMQAILDRLGSMLTVALWIGGSAFATKLLELLTEYATNHDFGNYTFVVMGIVNMLGVIVKEVFTAQPEPEAVETSDVGV